MKKSLSLLGLCIILFSGCSDKEYIDIEICKKSGYKGIVITQYTNNVACSDGELDTLGTSFKTSKGIIIKEYEYNSRYNGVQKVHNYYLEFK